MKHQLIDCFTKALVLLAGFTVCSTAFAQPLTKPCYSAGNGPQFTVTLHGKYVGTLTNLNVTVKSDATAAADRVNSFGSPGVRPSSPGVFTVTVLIPVNAANGKYSISDINANGDGFNVAYRPQMDFTPPAPFEVCTAFEKPSITSIIEHP
jgi:hypothetical protein